MEFLGTKFFIQNKTFEIKNGPNGKNYNSQFLAGTFSWFLCAAVISSRLISFCRNTDDSATLIPILLFSSLCQTTILCSLFLCILCSLSLWVYYALSPYEYTMLSLCVYYALSLCVYYALSLCVYYALSLYAYTILSLYLSISVYNNLFGILYHYGLLSLYLFTWHLLKSSLENMNSYDVKK